MTVPRSEIVNITDFVIVSPELSNIDGIGDVSRIGRQFSNCINRHILALLRKKIIGELVHPDYIDVGRTHIIIQVPLVQAFSAQVSLFEGWIICS